MKSKFMRSLLAVLGIGALLIALVAVNPTTTTAANLTGGNYTYLVDGEEVTFTFDPISRKDGLLLPLEVFAHFGIKVDGTTTRNISLTRGKVIAKVTLGTTQADIDGVAKTVSTAPLRLNGRVFLPSDLLKEFGLEFTQDGTYVIMRNLLEKVPETNTFTDSQWTEFKTTRGFSYNIKADNGITLEADFILMNSDMVNSTNLGMSYGTRVRLNYLFQSSTLVLIHLQNHSNRSGGMTTTGLYIVDDRKNQYEVKEVFDLGEGLLSAKLAPASERWGVLAFPKLPENASVFQVYYDSNASGIGTFPLTK